MFFIKKILKKVKHFFERYDIENNFVFLVKSLLKINCKLYKTEKKT